MNLESNSDALPTAKELGDSYGIFTEFIIKLNRVQKERDLLLDAAKGALEVCTYNWPEIARLRKVVAEMEGK